MVMHVNGQKLDFLLFFDVRTVFTQKNHGSKVSFMPERLPGSRLTPITAFSCVSDVLDLEFKLGNLF